MFPATGNVVRHVVDRRPAADGSDAVPHGFRSYVPRLGKRAYVHPGGVSEMALAHASVTCQKRHTGAATCSRSAAN